MRCQSCSLWYILNYEESLQFLSVLTRVKRGLRGWAWENNLMSHQHKSLFNLATVICTFDKVHCCEKQSKNTRTTPHHPPTHAHTHTHFLPLWSLQLGFYFNHILAVRLKEQESRPVGVEMKRGRQELKTVAALIASSRLRLVSCSESVSNPEFERCHINTVLLSLQVFFPYKNNQQLNVKQSLFMII